MPTYDWTKTAYFPNEDADIYSLCVFGSKIYAGTHNTPSGIYQGWAQVYESDDGITWTLNHSFDDVTKASDDSIVGMVVFNSKLYALRNYATQTRLYEYDGVTWSLTKNIQADYTFSTPKHLATDGSKLYIAGGITKAKILYSASTPSGTWTNELAGSHINAAYVIVCHSGDIFVGGVSDLPSSGTYIYRKTGGSWDSGTLFSDDGNVADGVVFNDKVYFAMVDRVNPTTQYNIECWNGASWDATVNISGLTVNIPPFLAVSDDNFLYTYAPKTGTDFYLYKSPDGTTFSTKESLGTTGYPWIPSKSSCNFNGGTFFGAGLGHLTNYRAAVYYRTSFVNNALFGLGL